MRLPQLTLLALIIGLFGGSCASTPPSHPSLSPEFSIVQGASSDTETQLSILVPKNSAYLYLLVSPSNTQILPHFQKTFSRSFSPISVVQLQFTDLKPNTEYELLITDSQNVVHDSRKLKTFPDQRKSFRFMFTSCMDDGFEEVQRNMWNGVREASPDFIFLIGDNVYGDKEIGFYQGPANPEVLWNRYIETFQKVDFYHFKKLIPVFAIWDDHDYGQNNGNLTYPYKKEALEILEIFYPRKAISPQFTKGPGASALLKIANQNFFLLDNRSFRTPEKAKTEEHFGKEVENWLFQNLKKNHQPAWLIKGDQYFGGYHRFESYEGNHPHSFKKFLSRLKQIHNPFIFISGDRHTTEAMKISKKEVGLDTYEFTASPLHAKLAGEISPGEWNLSKNPRGFFGSDLNYNFMVFDVKNADSVKKMEFHIQSISLDSQVLFEQDLTVQRN